MRDKLSIEPLAAQIKLLLMDCDGVLTDGRIWLFEDGSEQKCFDVRDGLGLALFHRSVLRSGIISSRQSAVVGRRAIELGITFVRQGSADKLGTFHDLINEAGVSQNEVAYIGDDLNDIPLMQQAGLAFAVADATYETRAAAHYVTIAKGGRGAVREVVEIILKAQGRWSELVGERKGSAPQ